MTLFLNRSFAAYSSVTLCLLTAYPAIAEPLDLVITPSRTEQPISRAGSAISIISREQIEKASSQDIGDLLRIVPGLTVAQNGGPGQTQTVRIRGGESRHTLVMIDGIRVNDPASTGREFDFSNLILSDVERIEVLRGPQSALYGSDAMGGVINIITRKAKPGFRASLSAGMGQFNTKETKGSISASDGRSWINLGASFFDTNGFSAYGYRIKRLERAFPSPFEADGARRFGITGRAGTALNEDISLEIGGTLNRNLVDYDSAFGTFPDTGSKSEGLLASGYARMKAAALGGTLQNSLTLFAAQTNRVSRTEDIFAFFGPPTTFQSRYEYRGATRGLEYQGDLRLGPYGTLTFGAKLEEEQAKNVSQDLAPFASDRNLDLSASQTTRSVFASHQFSLGERLHLSLGGRIDDVKDVDTFATWRATLAYDVFETGTKFRTSLGTGGKAPSLFQLYSPFYGTSSLQSERSFGIDAGIDQSLMDGRIILSGTVFLNRYRDLISFGNNPQICAPTQFFGCYFNTARAETSGLELAGSADLIPGWLNVNVTYTFLDAHDQITDKKLARRPEHEGRIAFSITPLKGLNITPAVVFVGERFDGSNETGKLPSYARLDVDVDYKINDTVSVFAKARNVTDTRYEEVRHYGTMGRAFFGGVRATW
jgi:vitamin B12 transporter